MHLVFPHIQHLIKLTQTGEAYKILSPKWSVTSGDKRFQQMSGLWKVILGGNDSAEWRKLRQKALAEGDQREADGFALSSWEARRLPVQVCERPWWFWSSCAPWPLSTLHGTLPVSDFSQNSRKERQWKHMSAERREGHHFWHYSICSLIIIQEWWWIHTLQTRKN